MINDFQPSLNFVLSPVAEGGWSDNPHDPGGPTNHGITLATLSHELGRQATVEDLRAIPAAVVASIYRKKFWNAIGADRLDAGVDLLAFDVAVNSGVGRALRFLNATRNLDARARILAIDKTRRGFWRGLPIFRFFARGWLRRADAALHLALSL